MPGCCLQSRGLPAARLPEHACPRCPRCPGCRGSPAAGGREGLRPALPRPVRAEQPQLAAARWARGCAQGARVLLVVQWSPCQVTVGVRWPPRSLVDCTGTISSSAGAGDRQHSPGGGGRGPAPGPPARPSAVCPALASVSGQLLLGAAGGARHCSPAEAGPARVSLDWPWSGAVTCARPAPRGRMRKAWLAGGHTDQQPACWWREGAAVGRASTRGAGRPGCRRLPCHPELGPCLPLPQIGGSCFYIHPRNALVCDAALGVTLRTALLVPGVPLPSVWPVHPACPTEPCPV